VRLTAKKQDRPILYFLPLNAVAKLSIVLLCDYYVCYSHELWLKVYITTLPHSVRLFAYDSYKNRNKIISTKTNIMHTLVF